METLVSLDDILALIPVKDKDNLTVTIVEKGLTQDPNFIEKAIKILEKGNKYAEAVKLAKKLSPERVKKVYSNQIEYYEKCGYLVTADQLQELIELSKKARDSQKAEHYELLYQVETD